MYCKKCGAELREDAKFCNKCGQATVSAYQPSHGISGTGSVYMPQNKQRRSPKAGNILAGSIIATLAIVLVVVIANALGIGGVGSSSPRDPAKITIDQMKSDVLNAGALSDYNLFFHQVDSFKEFAVAKTEVSNDKDKVNYHVDYVVHNGHLAERGIMLANDYTEGRIVIQYLKKANGTWVFNGFEVG